PCAEANHHSTCPARWPTARHSRRQDDPPGCAPPPATRCAWSRSRPPPDPATPSWWTWPRSEHGAPGRAAAHFARPSRSTRATHRERQAARSPGSRTPWASSILQLARRGSQLLRQRGLGTLGDIEVPAIPISLLHQEHIAALVAVARVG